MRKTIKIAMVVVVAAVAGMGGYSSQKADVTSDIALANVEALAQGESGGQGTLYGNSGGTQFCCCPGSNSCAAAKCTFC